MRNPKQIQMAKIQNRLKHLDLKFWICFVFRYSDFEFIFGKFKNLPKFSKM